MSSEVLGAVRFDRRRVSQQQMVSDDIWLSRAIPILAQRAVGAAGGSLVVVEVMYLWCNMVVVEE